MHSSSETSHLDDLRRFIDQMSHLIDSATSYFRTIEAHGVDTDISPDDLASASFMVIALTNKLRHMQEAYHVA